MSYHIKVLMLKLTISLAGFGMCSSLLAELFPQHTLYPEYLADPLRPIFNAQYQYYSQSTIADTGNRRIDLKLGANLPLYESSWSNTPWQLVLIAGFLSWPVRQYPFAG